MVSDLGYDINGARVRSRDTYNSEFEHLFNLGMWILKYLLLCTLCYVCISFAGYIMYVLVLLLRIFMYLFFGMQNSRPTIYKQNDH